MSAAVVHLWAVDAKGVKTRCGSGSLMRATEVVADVTCKSCRALIKPRRAPETHDTPIDAQPPARGALFGDPTNGRIVDTICGGDLPRAFAFEGRYRGCASDDSYWHASGAVRVVVYPDDCRAKIVVFSDARRILTLYEIDFRSGTPIRVLLAALAAVAGA